MYFMQHVVFEKKIEKLHPKKILKILKNPFHEKKCNLPM